MRAGFFFAALMSSGTVFSGESPFATSTNGYVTTIDTPSRSRNGSYGSVFMTDAWAV